MPFSTTLTAGTLLDGRTAGRPCGWVPLVSEGIFRGYGEKLPPKAETYNFTAFYYGKIAEKSPL